MRENSNKRVPSTLIASHDMLYALGKNETNFTWAVDSPAPYRVLVLNHFDSATQYAYNNQAARITDSQRNAISHIISELDQKHGFILMGYGTGKSGIKILTQLG